MNGADGAAGKSNPPLGELAYSSVADMYPPAGLSKAYDIDIQRLHRHRVDRLHAEMDKRDCDALLLFDPVNIRYATGARNMQIWTMHHPARYCLVVRGGKIVLFEIGGRAHHARGLPLIDEVRVAKPWFYYYSGPGAASHVKDFAAEIAELVGTAPLGFAKKRIYVDRCDRQGTRAL